MIRPTNHQPALFEIADDGTTHRPPEAPTICIRRYRLELVAETSSIYEGNSEHGEQAFSHPSAAARFLFSQIGNRPQEHMCALYLDTRNRPLGWTVAHIGTINRAAVEPRSILVTGLGLNAVGFLIAHNHPSGHPTPSSEDLAFTRRMAEAGDVVGLRLLDHIILGVEDRWVSLKQRGGF